MTGDVGGGVKADVEADVEGDAVDLVLGVDIGGTATRALVTTAAGAPLGAGRSGPGNPVTGDPVRAAANISAALTGALDALDPARIRAAVVGAAGASRPAVIHAACRDAGIRCPVRVVGDVVVAFAAGTAAPAGTALIAGTGAVAAEISGDRLVRVADGLGWLLGDLGSGFWLGRAAVVASARVLHRGEDRTPLIESVTAALGERAADPLVAAVYRRPPRDLADLAPLVTAAAVAGDPHAVAIVAEAAGHLCDTVAAVREPGDRRPIVLAGGVLRHGGPLPAVVRRRLAATWPDADTTLAEPGEIGAARLAARTLPAR